MAKNNPTPLNALTTLCKDGSLLRAIVDTPKGSRNKYKYDADSNGFELKHILPEGMNFPFDFGFLPSTLGEDGDPLDVLIFMDAAALPGCIVKIRLLGAIEARQQDEGKKWVRNDRLIAVAEKTRLHQGLEKLADLAPQIVADVKAFFVQYNKLLGRKFECLRDAGPKAALNLVQEGQQSWKKQNSKAA